MTDSRRKLIATAFGLDRAPGRAGNMSVATESGRKRRSFAHWTKLSIWKRLTLVWLVPSKLLRSLRHSLSVCGLCFRLQSDHIEVD